MRLTSILRYSLYNIVRRRPQSKSFLPLYKSSIFNGSDFNQTISKGQSLRRYKEFLPYLLLAQTDAFKPKILVTQLEFNPEVETIRVTSLRARGIISQQFNVNNIIPITYSDMRAFNKLPQPQLPVYIDETMTYFNRFNQDIYIFEQDGSWDQKTVNHPKLSLESRLDEKEWFDRRPII